MDYTILTHKGFNIDVTADTTMADLADQLNNPELLTLALADMVLSKGNFKTIVKAGETTGAYELHTADGKIYETDIEDYDSDVLSDLINQSNDNFVLIGDIIIQRYNFDMIRVKPE